MIAVRSEAAKAEDTRGPRKSRGLSRSAGVLMHVREKLTALGGRAGPLQPMLSAARESMADSSGSVPATMALPWEATQSKLHFQRNQARLVML